MAAARWWPNVAWSVVLVVCMAASVLVQWRQDAAKLENVDVNLLVVPPEELTKAMATGMENLIADGLWLGFLQYYGDRLVANDKRAVYIAPMFNLITDLDQRFWFAYWLGAWALGDNEQGDQAAALLEKGDRLNPEDYNYIYLEGFVQFLFRKDYDSAARCFELAQKKPNAPRFAHTMAARMYQKKGLDQQALEVWENLYRSAPEKTTRGIAKRNIDRIRDEMAGKRPRAFKVGKPKPGEPL